MVCLLYNWSQNCYIIRGTRPEIEQDNAPACLRSVRSLIGPRWQSLPALFIALWSVRVPWRLQGPKQRTSLPVGALALGNLCFTDNVNTLLVKYLSEMTSKSVHQSGTIFMTIIIAHKLIISQSSSFLLSSSPLGQAFHYKARELRRHLKDGSLELNWIPTCINRLYFIAWSMADAEQREESTATAKDKSPERLRWGKI